jgi:hypothetical protein
VQDPGHWVFGGTGLCRGESFGANTSPPLVGYECDGAPLERFDKATGLAVLSSNAPSTGTPSGFRVLAASLLDDDWQERPPREMYPAATGIHAATMGIFSRNGTVFAGGTTDWAQVLENARDPHVDTITRNVINGLLEE